MVFGERGNFSKKAIRFLEDEGNALYLSAVSAWEIGIKSALGKLEISPGFEKWIPEVLLQMGGYQLPISVPHALAVAGLPLIHKDPFDRLLIAQARVESMVILTPDPLIRKYDVETVE